MTTSPAWGFVLRNGSRIVHGAGANIRPAFPPDLGIPGTLHLFSPGAAGDSTGSTPTFKGAMGYFPFDTSMRMPRHVHMTPQESGSSSRRRFIVEKVLTVSGIGLAELAGEVYVVPPLTMVLIAPGVPHSWTACPAGVDLKALGLSGTENLVSDGKFAAMFEYEDATTFYPTAQTNRLESVEDYVPCDDLHSIRFPQMSAEDVARDGWFIWGMKAEKLPHVSSQI